MNTHEHGTVDNHVYTNSFNCYQYYQGFSYLLKSCDGGIMKAKFLLKTYWIL